MASYNLGQNRKIFSNQIDSKLDYYYIINQKSNLNITIGTILIIKLLTPHFSILDLDNSIFPTPAINEGLSSNDVTYNFSDFYLGAHYRFRTGIFTFTPGFSLHAYGNKNIQNSHQIEDDFIRLLPDFEMRIQLKKVSH